MNEQFIDRVIGVLLEMRLNETGEVKKRNKKTLRGKQAVAALSRENPNVKIHPVEDPKGKAVTPEMKAHSRGGVEALRVNRARQLGGVESPAGRFIPQQDLPGRFPTPKRKIP